MKRAETLKAALDELSRVIDNPIDPFSAMQDLIQLKWQPGQDIGDYYFLAKRKAAHAGTTLKFIGSLVSTQLPKEVQNRIKDTAIALNDDLEHADAFKFIAEVKQILTDKGIALNFGNRNAVQGIKLASLKEKEVTNMDDSESNSQDKRLLHLWRETSLEVLSRKTLSKLWSKGPHLAELYNPVKAKVAERY